MAFSRGKGPKLAKCLFESIGSDDLCRLRPGTWFNDSLINFVSPTEFYFTSISWLIEQYGAMVQQRADVEIKNGGVNIHVFSSLVYQIMQTRGFEKGRIGRCSKKVRLSRMYILCTLTLRMKSSNSSRKT